MKRILAKPITKTTTPDKHWLGVTPKSRCVCNCTADQHVMKVRAGRTISTKCESCRKCTQWRDGWTERKIVAFKKYFPGTTEVAPDA